MSADTNFELQLLLVRSNTNLPYIYLELSYMYKKNIYMCLGHHKTTEATTPPPCTQRDDCDYMDCAGNHGQDHQCVDGACVCQDPN